MVQPSRDAERLLSTMMEDVGLSLRPQGLLASIHAPSNNATRPAQQRRFSDADQSAARAVARTDAHTGRSGGRFHFPALDIKDERHRQASDCPESPSTAEKSSPSSEAPLPLQQHYCKSQECAVMTMFETTELLELILDFLDTSSIMALRRTNKHWDQTIRTSPSLRLHRFVRPQWSRHAADFQLLDLKLPGLSIVPGDDLEMGKWIHVSMTSAAARRICTADGFGRQVRSRSIYEGMRGGLGRRARRDSGDDSWPRKALPTREKGMLCEEDLFVVQPPVLGMQAYIVDPEQPCGSSSPLRSLSTPAATAKLHCDSGITLGFLAETTQSLLFDPRRSSGSDSRTVLFKAIISFTSTTGRPRRHGSVRSVTRLS